MRIDIVTLFPAMVEGPLAESMIGRARQRGLVDIRVINLRDHAVDRHRTTDDYQFGGGGGMVLKPEPLFAAVAALRTPETRVILMDPRGRRFTQEVAQELAGGHTSSCSPDGTREWTSACAIGWPMRRCPSAITSSRAGSFPRWW